nr:MAG TPA: hypothetical protein [Caudoviricetes sp.]
MLIWINTKIDFNIIIDWPLEIVVFFNNIF